MESTSNRKRTAILPALQLEKELGLTGIGQRYVMPDGKTMEDLYHTLFDLFVGDMTDVPAKRKLALHYAESFCALNPAMKPSCPPPEDFAKTVDFIRGMTSGFNKDDIEFFLYIPANMRKEIGDKQTEFFEQAGITGLNWMPCPKTFDSIVAQLTAKHGDDWASTKKAKYNGMPFFDSDAGLFVQIDFE